VLDALRGLERDPRPLLLDDLADAPWSDAAGSDATGVGPCDRSARTTAPGAAVVALPGSGVPAGALVLLRRPAGPGTPAAASAGDAALVEEFAQRAGIAQAAAAFYAQQVRTIAVLRSSLAQPALPSVTFGAAYRPSDEGLLIGGDVYDVLPRSGTRRHSCSATSAARASRRR
jgi:hypothetical protein